MLAPSSSGAVGDGLELLLKRELGLSKMILRHSTVRDREGQGGERVVFTDESRMRRSREGEKDYNGLYLYYPIANLISCHRPFALFFLKTP